MLVLLESRRSTVLYELMAVVFQLIKRPCSTGFNGCNRTSDWFSKLMNNIRNMSLDSISATNMSLGDIIQKLEKFTVPNMNTGLSTCSATIQGQPGGLDPLPITAQQLKQLLEEATKQYKGLCLDCVRAGGIYNGTCRIPHN